MKDKPEFLHKKSSVCGGDIISSSLKKTVETYGIQITSIQRLFLAASTRPGKYISIIYVSTKPPKIAKSSSGKKSEAGF